MAEPPPTLAETRPGAGAGSKTRMDRHTLIVVILSILFLGSLAFSIFVITSGDEKESEEELALAKLKADLQQLQQLQQEKQQLEKEKVQLEQEKRLLQQKKQALEEQLVEEIESRPVFNADKDSPFDHLKDSQVRVLKDKVEIDIAEVTWWTISDTHSMDPLLDVGSTALSIKPKSEESVHVGDVALYDSLLVKTVIIHRVIKTAQDTRGWYSTFKGDNLEEPDPEKVRFPQVKGVLIGIIY